METITITERLDPVPIGSLGSNGPESPSFKVGERERHISTLRASKLGISLDGDMNTSVKYKLDRSKAPVNPK